MCRGDLRYSDDVSKIPTMAKQFLYSLLIMVGTQAFQTTGLRSVELLVDLSRNESTRRRANAVQPWSTKALLEWKLSVTMNRPKYAI
jgi:hypothetical protein